MNDKDRTLKALEDMKESMAYAVRRRATADVVSLEAQVLALQTQLAAAELKAKEWIDVAYEAASQKEELKRELERVERETIEAKGEGYVLAMTVLHSDMVLNDTEVAARDYFLPKSLKW